MARLSLKADSERYFLGYLWWILEPLLWVAIFYLVFEVFLKSGTHDFLAFLAVGKLNFVWFSKSISQSSSSLIAARGLIGRLDLPKWLFPIATCQEGLYKQIFVIALLLSMLIYKGYQPTFFWLFLLPLLFLQYLMTITVALVSALLVCVRQDFQYLVQLGMVLLMFLSGIFWDVNSISDASMREHLFLFNPMATMLDSYRDILIRGTSPSGERLMVVVTEVLVLGALVGGLYVKLHFWIAKRVITQ